MRFSVWSGITICLLSLFNNGACFGQDSQSDFKLMQQAQKEYDAGQLAEAERDFRELTKRLPSAVYMHVYLGQSLFEQSKFREAIGPYETARSLEKRGKKLTSDQHRILTDQLAMAYGVSGELKKAHALLEDAVQQDPEYPLNYYNLACAFAQEGDKTKMLANLSLAFKHKDHVVKGENLPDPRADFSFRDYVQDPDFVGLMNEIGYK
jgi:predicted Zn-dependent protease